MENKSTQVNGFPFLLIILDLNKRLVLVTYADMKKKKTEAASGWIGSACILKI